MDPKDYKEKKAKGLAEVVKAGGGHAFAIKRFSQDDGSELVPEIESVDIEDLAIRKAELEEEIEDYTELMDDIGKLEIEEKSK